MTSTIKRFIVAMLRRVIARHYWLVVAMSLLITGLAVWVIATKWNINSDFKALLPVSSEAYQAMEEVGERAGSGSALFVVIDSPDGDANIEFAELFTQKLGEMPHVALAHFKNEKEFFEAHQLLYLETEDLRELHDRIEKQIRDAKREANPLFVSLGSPGDSDDDALDVEDLEEKYADLAHNTYKEYMVSDDGYSLTIVVRFVESSTDLTSTNELIKQVQGLGEELNPTSFNPEMVIEYGGGLINRQAEYSSILSDFKASILSTVIGLFLVIALYFRRLRAIFFVLGPLIMSVIWTLALGFLIFGELTTVAAFIFAVLLGLGIDYSIHLLNEYDIARRKGLEPVEALIDCFGTTGKATVVGALTTIVTFVVLSFAQFRGLSQFGQVASIGIVCTVIAMLVVLPAMILALQSVLPYTPSDRKSADASMLSPAYWIPEEKARRFTPLFLGIALLICVAAGFLVSSKLGFEEDFPDIGEMTMPWEDRGAAEREEQQSLGAKRARQAADHVRISALSVRENIDPDTYIPPREQKTLGQKYTSAMSGMRSSTPTLLLFDDEEEAHRVYDVLAKLHQEGELDTVRSVAAIYSFLPGTQAQQEERLAEIARIKKLLADDDLSSLKKKDRERIDELRGRLDVEAFDIHDLPEWTKRLFKESGDRAKPAAEGEEYAFEYLIYVNEAINSMRGGEARRFLGQLQDVRDETQADFRIGSQAYIYTAMLDEIKTDGLRMMGIALLVVLLILSVAFGNPLRGLYALLPVLLGTFWMLGFAAFLDFKLDFFNVIIIPVLIGAGVDDGVHFYSHYLEEGRGSIGSVMRSLGGALVMTTITTVIGFASLAATNYPGLQSIGFMACFGMVMSLLATMLVLPSLLWIAEKYDINWLAGDSPADSP